jgi:uncharacterized protein YjiS (DUF1127 family)
MTNLNVTALPKPGTAPYRQAMRAAARIVALLLRPLAEAYRARCDAEHLINLNDDLLRDIGIARWEIEGAVRRGGYDGHGRWG